MLKIHFLMYYIFCVFFFNPAVMGCIIYLLCLLYLSNFREETMELQENYGLLKKILKLFVHGLAQAVLKFLSISCGFL